MNTEIKAIEDLSLNAWPSHQMQLYDGWILRFSYFYTHRTNCIEQIGASSLPIEEKLAYCEQIYQRWSTPCIFKISPLVGTPIDEFLERRGYIKAHITDVMTLDLSGSVIQPPSTQDAPIITLNDSIDSTWINALFSLKQTASAIHRRIVPSMYAAIPKDVICARIIRNDEIIATGLGILDRDYIGLYAIHVRQDYRSQGLAHALCQSILTEGMAKGATKAYLQVVSDNERARALYASLGFQKLYTYWFREKRVI